MRSVYAAALTAALSLSSPMAAAVDEVTLRSVDGSLELSGRFLSYDGRYFRIDAVFGVLMVDGAEVVCEGTRCPDPDGFVTEIYISGATEAGRTLLPSLLDAFATENGLALLRQVEDETRVLYVLSDPAEAREVIRIRVHLTTSSEGLADLVAEAADIALSLREATSEESARSLEVGLGNLRSPEQSRVLALDGLVAAVSPDNPLAAISMNDLTAILRGQVTDWSALGLSAAPIALHLPAKGTGIARAMADQLEAAPDETTARRHQTGDMLDDAVASDPHALGIMALSDADASRALPLLGRCDAVLAPTPWSLKTEDYPLTTPHFLVTPERRMAPRARAFLEFLASDDAQRVIAETGFIDQGIETRALADQGERLIRSIVATGQDVNAKDLRDLVERLDGARQTTLTFRFEERETTLDAQSNGNVALLARAIEAGDMDGQTIVLAGFTDARGAGAQNQRLSRQRAASVRDAVLALLPDDLAPDIQVEGFGELMPLACDQDEWGRKANRRVEVWLLPQ